MFRVRHSADRGHADHGWLVARHTFSFAGYHDPQHMGFRDLRVMNEDRIAPGRGFDTHPHRDMEIVTLVLSGELEHRDSMGNGSIIRPGELQAMSAGAGVLHSEFNPSPTEATHLYQVWIKPDRRGVAPRYQQQSFSDAEKQGRWRLVASPDGANGSLAIHQDARLYQAKLSGGGEIDYAIAEGRHAWLQLLRGEARVGEWRLAAGDGLEISDERRFTMAAEGAAEALLFDLP